MRLLIVFFMLSLSGCGLDVFRTTDGSPGLGTHVYTINPDGSVTVDVHSVYGGPGLEITTEGDKRTVTLTPAGKITAADLIPLLK